MSLIFLTLSKLKELVHNKAKLITSLRNIPSEDIKQLYNEYQSNKLLIKDLFNNEDWLSVKKKLYQLIPKLKLINKQLRINDEFTFVLGLFDKLSVDLVINDFRRERDEYKRLKLKLNAYSAYLNYLIRKKLGLLNHSIPGVNQVEKELGIKPFD